jgi:NAD(P)H dehydrogenase (quinone)
VSLTPNNAGVVVKPYFHTVWEIFMYAVTGASGRLGRLVIDILLTKLELSTIVALVRDTAKVADLTKRGVIVRAFNYDRPETLLPALESVERLLLISSSEVGQRERQHRAVINAAQSAVRQVRWKIAAAFGRP